MGGFLEPSPVPAEERTIPGRAILIGLACVAGAVALIFAFYRPSPRQSGPRHPYSANIQLSDLKMSAAENFVGATVSYLEGKVTNNGDKTVTGASVQVTFSNSLGEVVQREHLPLRVLQSQGGLYTEGVDLALAPLAPHQTRPFRLTFEHISSGWNQQYPEVKVEQVAVK